jgi:hypothetical protein
MKLVKIILAGIVGGILIFMWGFVAHMLLGIGEMGVTPMDATSEAAILPVVREHIHNGGFYFMPGMDPEKMKNMTAADSAAYDEKYKAGASGIMIIAPIGEPAFSNMPMRLAKELGTDIAAAILGALIIFWGVDRSSLFRTFGMSLAMGLMAWFLISTSYNIWFRFPRDYVIGEGLTEVIGFAIAGIGFYIVSLFFKRKMIRKTDLDSGAVANG